MKDNTTSKTLIITGGAGGIGRSTALAAAQQGWDVCVNYSRNSGPAEEIVSLIQKDGGKAISIKADITNEGDVIRLFNSSTDQLGPVTGLVNCAGMTGPMGRIDKLQYEDLLLLNNLNINAVFLCCREAVKRMSTIHGGQGGSIVLISSVAARIGAPVPYAASKGAVSALGLGLAKEVAREGIRVNVVSPGLIDTAIQPPGRVEREGPHLPAGRAGKPEEVANAIVWLLSDGASYIAGTNLEVSYAH